jgi:hypothetical protein
VHFTKQTGRFNRLIFNPRKIIIMTTHQSPKKSHDNEDEKKTGPSCPLCKTVHPKGKDVPPIGICHKCQGKIGVVILIIMVITTGMLFFGII